MNSWWKLFARTRRAIILTMQEPRGGMDRRPRWNDLRFRFYVPQNRFHPGSYFACYQVALEYLGIGVSEQRQMRDREEQQQKAQLHRVPSARRSCNERPSAHNYRNRFRRTLSAAKRPLWSIFPGAMTCISIWLFARSESTFEWNCCWRKKEKANAFRTVGISHYRRYSFGVISTAFLLLLFDFSVFSFSPNVRMYMFGLREMYLK